MEEPLTTIADKLAGSLCNLHIQPRHFYGKPGYFNHLFGSDTRMLFGKINNPPDIQHLLQLGSFHHNQHLAALRRQRLRRRAIFHNSLALLTIPRMAV